VTLASIFFPDPWGSAPRIPLPAALQCSCHPRTAIPRRSLPTRHTPPVRAARAP
jgi:hypothetical protein